MGLTGFALGSLAIHTAHFMNAQNGIRDALHVADAPDALQTRFRAAGDQMVKIIREIALYIEDFTWDTIE